MQYYEVGVNAPIAHRPFGYLSNAKYLPGDFVTIPFGRRQEKGIVLSGPIEPPEKPEFKLKEIQGPLEGVGPLNEKLLKFYEWASRYYHYPIGKIIFDGMPKILKRPTKYRGIEGRGIALGHPLTKTQEEHTQGLLKKFAQGNIGPYLIHGITGSGKSLIYLKLIQQALTKEQNVLLLLPEINLTPQFIEFFQNHLEGTLWPYHSAVNNSKKYLAYKQAEKNESGHLFIGARSSLFLPIKNLGLIIVDEEHDQSYKQTDRCAYHARDLAIMRSKFENCPIVMGSATPAMESYCNYKRSGDYFSLTSRWGDQALPDIEVIDLTKIEKPHKKKEWPFTEKSLEALDEAKEKGEQALVFINRLGFSGHVLCSSCGKKYECSSCNISLRYFKKRHSLECPTCEYKEQVPEFCSECGNLDLIHKGHGTERVAEVLKKLRPNLNVERFDRDEITTHKQLEEVLARFQQGDIDVLVGTQMLSKGHNFAKVNTVVVLGIDGQFNFPDFRSVERAYQQLMQISGRAGRTKGKGRVFIQTWDAENTVFDFMKSSDISSFYESEIPMRQALMVPPFGRLCMLYISGPDLKVVQEFSTRLESSWKNLVEKHFPKIIQVVARSCFMEKRANQYSWFIQIRAEDAQELQRLLQTVWPLKKTPSRISLKLDIDSQFYI